MTQSRLQFVAQHPIFICGFSQGFADAIIYCQQVTDRYCWSGYAGQGAQDILQLLPLGIQNVA
jgi:hypothetical protein